MSSSDANIAAVRKTSTWRRSMRPDAVVINKLVATANKPEIEMAWPAIPSLTARARAIGVSRLSGMKSEAMSRATHIVIAPMALDADRARGKAEVES